MAELKFVWFVNQQIPLPVISMQLPMGRGQFNSNPHLIEQWKSSAVNWRSVCFCFCFLQNLHNIYQKKQSH